MRWFSPAFPLPPDIEVLSDSGHIKFKSIDVKLVLAMIAILKAGQYSLRLVLRCELQGQHIRSN